MFVVNAQKRHGRCFRFFQPAQPTYIQSLDAKTYLIPEVNSVAVHNGIVALAVQAEIKPKPVGLF